jgi:hypothetical protein
MGGWAGLGIFGVHCRRCKCLQLTHIYIQYIYMLHIHMYQGHISYTHVVGLTPTVPASVWGLA